MEKSAQEEFIATVSHELRTPLTSIRGFSQTLLASWDKLDDTGKKKFIGIIEEQSNRLINLVENILTVSKINSDKPLFRAVNINKSIDTVVQMLSQKYKETQINVSYNKNIPPVKLDDEKFQQVMTNIIDNACKYSGIGKSIFVSTTFYDEKYVLIKVKDNGVGIDKEYKDKIFEKFIRIENHLTSKTQGNGLGLYITKQLVDLMNGEISFESIPNKGTEFCLKFQFYNQEDALKCSLQS